MQGQIVVITGANSGIGRAAAEQIAGLGAHVVLVVRHPGKGEEAMADLQRRTGRDAFELVVADLSELSQVRKAASEIRARHPKIHVLLNNAGVYLPTRRLTSDGHEMMFALNHLAPFLLTHELKEPLAAAAPSRVITTSSGAHMGGHIEFDNLDGERSFNALRQYCNTKLANILFTRELARRWEDLGVNAHSFHPGTVRTGFAQDEPGLFGTLVRVVSPFLRSPDKAARTATFLASSEEAMKTRGQYWVDSKIRTPSREARNDEVARRLWEVSERLTGLR